MPLYIPDNYTNLLGSLENTEKAIKAVKDMFQDNLSAQLALLRVTAPMVVMSGTAQPRSPRWREQRPHPGGPPAQRWP